MFTDPVDCCIMIVADTSKIRLYFLKRQQSMLMPHDNLLYTDSGVLDVTIEVFSLSFLLFSLPHINFSLPPHQLFSTPPQVFSTYPILAVTYTLSGCMNVCNRPIPAHQLDHQASLPTTSHQMSCDQSQHIHLSQRSERGVSTAREWRHCCRYAVWEARHSSVGGAWEGRHRGVRRASGASPLSERGVGGASL